MCHAHALSIPIVASGHIFNSTIFPSTCLHFLNCPQRCILLLRALQAEREIKIEYENMLKVYRCNFALVYRHVCKVVYKLSRPRSERNQPLPESSSLPLLIIINAASPGENQDQRGRRGRSRRRRRRRGSRLCIACFASFALSIFSLIVIVIVVALIVCRSSCYSINGHLSGPLWLWLWLQVSAKNFGATLACNQCRSISFHWKLLPSIIPGIFAIKSFRIPSKNRVTNKRVFSPATNAVITKLNYYRTLRQSGSRVNHLHTIICKYIQLFQYN